MRIWAQTDTGVMRQQNQDACYHHIYDAQHSLGVVCDGMGGAAAGNIASELAIHVFTTSVQASLDETGTQSIDAILRRAAVDANRAVCDRARSDADCAGMGTTLVAALVVENTAYLANIGDSRAYYISNQGIKRITRDHSLVEDLVERGEISEEDARYHPQRNLITRALGAEDELDVDIFTCSLDAGSFLLLCSDGLTNVVESQELLYEVLHGGDVENCCQRLVSLVISRGAPDNVTVVLMQEGGEA